jgi:hypothetical protein
MTQKDNPTPPSREDVVREDYEKDPGGFEDKWGVDPSAPPPETQDPGAPGKRH